MALRVAYDSGWAAAEAAIAPRVVRSAPAVPVAVPQGGPVQAFTGWDMTDPRLVDFMRDGHLSATGVGVNAYVALHNSTFFRGVNLISGAVGMLPFHLMEQDPDGSNKRKARENPLFRVLHKRPNRYQTALEFKAYLQATALMHGNAYAYVVRSGRKIISLLPLRRERVQARLTADQMDVEFVYTRPAGGAVVLSSREMFHFRHPVTLDGIHGVSLLQMAADTIGIATAAQRAAGRLFKNGSFAPGVLETDQELGDEVHGRLKQDWQELYSGVENSGNWPILEQGLKAKNLSPNARESQHLETRQHEAEEIARFTGVPRPLLMFDETSWGSGIEQLGQMFVTYCLMPWFVAWEQAVERILDPSEEDRLYARFNAGALLRGSLKDQGDFFARALGAGGSAAWQSPNEVRDSFDMNPIPGGEDLPARPGGGAAVPVDDTPPASEPPPPPPRKKKD